jgi:hypothetical protein
MSASELTELCKKHAEWKALLQIEEDKLSEKKQAMKELEYKILSKLEEAEIKTYKLPTVGTFSIRTNTTWNLPKTEEDRKAYFDYLKKRGVFESMITVNSKKHSSFCKQVLEEMAEEDPYAAADFEIPGVPGKSTYDSLSVRKA